MSDRLTMDESDATGRSDELKRELKELIVSALGLEDIEPEEIKDDQPLFGSGIGLDSIDALELVVSLEKRYGIKIGSSEESKQALKSVDSLAALILSKRA